MTTMSSSSLFFTRASIAAGFPIKTLTPVASMGAPIATYQSLLKVQHELNNTASLVHGDGGSSLLVLTCPPTEFEDLLGYKEFIVPTNPTQNLTVPAGAMAKQIRNFTRMHNNDVRYFNLYQAVDTACKQQLLEACPTVFLEKLQHASLSHDAYDDDTSMGYLWMHYSCRYHG